jgi:hypothetical protein
MPSFIDQRSNLNLRFKSIDKRYKDRRRAAGLGRRLGRRPQDGPEVLPSESFRYPPALLSPLLTLV